MRCEPAERPFIFRPGMAAGDNLRATALFVQGRVAAPRAAGQAMPNSRCWMALSLNHEDMEALYTLGVVQMALQDDANGAAAFALVLTHEGRWPRSKPQRANRCRVLHAATGEGRYELRGAMAV